MLENGRPADDRDRHPYRPLPVLPRLHDDLPVGRQLHAPRRPCARPYREDLPAAAARPVLRAPAGLGAAASRPLPRRADAWPGSAARSRACWTGLPRPEAVRRDAGAGAGRAAGTSRRCRARPAARRRRAARPRGDPDRLRAVGAGPGINEAAIRLLNRFGVEVVVPEGEACCGALVHHMGREDAALEAARRNIDVWIARDRRNGGLDAIIVTASGCGTTIKDYGFMLRLDPAYAEKAARISALGPRRHRISRPRSTCRRRPRARPRRRLSLGLLDAARPEDHAPAEGTARKAGFAVRGAARGASVLRLGRHLQHHAARDRRRNCATAR